MSLVVLMVGIVSKLPLLSLNRTILHAREKEQIRDWLFKGPKESAPILIPIIQTLLLELVGKDPLAAVVLSFTFDCLG